MTNGLLVAVAVLAGCIGMGCVAVDDSSSESELRGRCAAEVTVEWTCDEITITSSKDLSNLVFQGDDIDDRIEFEAGGNTYVLPADGVDTIWVKSGCNASGDGPGYGERFDRPDDLICDVCPNPEELIDGECVPRCPFGTVRNEAGECVSDDGCDDECAEGCEDLTAPTFTCFEEVVVDFSELGDLGDGFYIVRAGTHYDRSTALDNCAGNIGFVGSYGRTTCSQVGTTVIQGNLAVDTAGNRSEICSTAVTFTDVEGICGIAN